MTLIGLGRSQARSSATRFAFSASSLTSAASGNPLAAAVAMSRYSSTSTKSDALGNGPMYEGQSAMPHLPVPALEQTLKKYLRSTVPHQTSESLAKTEAAVESALTGADAKLVQTLQQRLEDRATKEGRESWLSEWWNDAAYMAYRDPVVPYVSYFYAHKDDKTRRTGPKRAAGLLKAFLAFRRLLETEQLAPEKGKTGPLCMRSYKWMFNSNRIPEKPSDTAVKYDWQANNHLVVLRNGHFYEFDLVHNGQELSEAEIESQLQKILSDSASSQPARQPIGALSSNNRDKWTDSRKALAALPGNQEALERIDSSVIVVCLDEIAPHSLESTAWGLWCGDGKNRFYDKQQIITFANGKSGFMGEHSMMDGTPTLRLNDFALQALQAGKIDLGSSNRTDLPAPKQIQFKTDKTVEAKIEESIKEFNDLMGRHDLAILDFQGYGKGAIKKFKCSPDAWVQMVIQLAYFKMFGKPCPTYESAQTRKFKWGRTETIRSASVESLAFCKAMESHSASDAERFEKFQAAVKQHLSYATAAADGQGVDRHLFGLKKLLKQGEKVPAIYEDPAYGLSATWKLSTSQISSEVFASWGFGEVTPEGFGCAYAIKENSLTFTLTSLKLGAADLRHYINEAALELRDLHLRLQQNEAPKSKA
ncbi:putative carnitine O-acetyltransferase [Mycosarcoma maydis]|uniref:Carnitine O-acetyltransferase, mitochondrial n=1 Tax=Mycosarcoma maydis TaxID=5270 RepID=A0A0D1EAZ4_MYCMD|nr:putative carnitine O-acetyltransferase [Ustilago maydis 521]KIS72386.1 putative carnitine O-acetyltransferase [Ustilago maydis 521]|eukprot:XP_011386562.1 putative carnitine O-acetyltransferase [Ustilago maydis 521]